jgi:hypothetical protein
MPGIISWAKQNYSLAIKSITIASRNILLVFNIKDIKKIAGKSQSDVPIFSIQVVWTFFVLKVECFG